MSELDDLPKRRVTKGVAAQHLHRVAETPRSGRFRDGLQFFCALARPCTSSSMNESCQGLRKRCRCMRKQVKSHGLVDLEMLPHVSDFLDALLAPSLTCRHTAASAFEALKVLMASHAMTEQLVGGYLLDSVK